MIYYYYLMRFNISSRIHQFNQRNLERSCVRLIEDRRRLRVLSSDKSTLEKWRIFNMIKRV